MLDAMRSGCRSSCMDETNKQLIQEVREKLPVEPGQPERWEHEYVRCGVAQIFLEVETVDRSATCRGQRASHAPGLGPHWIQGMLCTRYPQAERGRVDPGQPQTPTESNRCMRPLPRRQARSLGRTPSRSTTRPSMVVGSNMAEIELSALCGQCLKPTHRRT